MTVGCPWWTVSSLLAACMQVSCWLRYQLVYDHVLDMVSGQHLHLVLQYYLVALAHFFFFFLLLVVYNCIFSSCHGVWKGGPNPAFRPLFWENPASRTFFISFPNPAFLSQKITLKSPISSKANKINARCTGRLFLLIDILNLHVFLKASQKEILAFCTSVWIELASLFAISRPIEC